jgi:hypothetical protein
MEGSKKTTSMSLLGVVIGIIAFFFISIAVGIVIILFSIYYWRKPQLIADSQQGKPPKWYWRLLIPSTPFVEVGAIVCIILIFIGGVFLMFGLVVLLTGSEGSISPIVTIPIGLAILIPGIFLAIKVVKQESEDWNNRISNKQVVVGRPSTNEKESRKFWAVIIIVPIIIVSLMAAQSFISQATSLPLINASYYTFANNTTATINGIPFEIEQNQNNLLISNIDLSLTDSNGQIVFNHVALESFNSGLYSRGFNFTDADRNGRLSNGDYFVLNSTVYPEKKITEPLLTTLTLNIQNGPMIFQLIVASSPGFDEF